VVFAWIIITAKLRTTAAKHIILIHPVEFNGVGNFWDDNGKDNVLEKAGTMRDAEQLPWLDEALVQLLA